MAAIASSSSSSSSIVVPNSHKYDVFLSFRGEDTRKNFTSHLYNALCREKILAYIDDNLERGEEISSALLTRIEESKLSVVIFSKNYASSRWCLDELVRIMKCKEEGKHIVLPVFVFYDVDPSDVRHQKGSYADAFLKYEECYKGLMNKVQEWRKALTAAANLSGFDSQQSASESKLVETIVKAVVEKLYSIPNITSDDFTGLVGMDKRFEKMESLLRLGHQDVRITGIWGMGGIGKTTVAETVYSRFVSQFEGCFFTTIKEEINEEELHHLKENMFSTLFRDEDLEHMNSSFANERLRRKKVLVVLDNVSKLKQLECLLGVRHVPISVSQWKKDRFGVGSRIILTSRDKKLLMTRADEIYEVEALDFNEALKLFCWKAFGGDSPMTNFVEISEKVVHYAQGNPLALDVLGSHLHSRSLREWESALIELEKAPHEEIHQVLKISYDALDERKKAMFLDIACFFIGEHRDHVEGILGVESHIGINILIEKSLITIKDSILSIHDLLQRMASEIVNQESKEVGRRSRLCNAQDVYHILKNNKGTAATEGIFLHLCKIHEDLCLRSTVFKSMCNLRFLIIYESYIGNPKSINVPQGLGYLPHSLRYIEWSRCPLKSLPSKFEPHNLIKLHMWCSKLKELWNGVKHLASLKDVDLRYSKELIKLPDLSQAPKLEKINLSGCESLRRLPHVSPNIRYIELEESGVEALPSSFGSLENLVSLNLSSCECLKSLPDQLPRNIEVLNLYSCKKLESLPSNIGKLKSLQHLYLSYCRRLKILPESLLHIRDLSLRSTGIEELPSTKNIIEGLTWLDLRHSENLKFVPKCLCLCPDLSVLNLDFCNIQEIQDWFGSLSSLTEIHLRGNKFGRIPPSIKQLYNLKYLYLCGCFKLRHLPELPPSILIVDASSCISLETVDISKITSTGGPYDFKMEFRFFNCFAISQSARDNILLNFAIQVFLVASSGFHPTVKAWYVGNVIPEWFDNQSEGSTTTIKLHPNVLNNNFLSFATCLALEHLEDDYLVCFRSLVIRTTFSFKTNYGEESFCFFHTEELGNIFILDHIFLLYYGNSAPKLCDMNLMNLEEVEASVEFFCNVSMPREVLIKVKRCGIRMINLQEVEEESPFSQRNTIGQSSRAYPTIDLIRKHFMESFKL